MQKSSADHSPLRRDFLHWAQLNVSIWNDQWWDAAAVYTGSATIVDGHPVIIYPGLFAPPPPHASSSGRGVGSNHDTRQKAYAMAVPSDPSDPLLSNWSKTGRKMNTTNPILSRVGDDPSTAWETPSKEWVFIGNSGCSLSKGQQGGAPLYGTMDWRRFYFKGCTTLPGGDCPTLFPLPSLTLGSEVGLTPQQRADLPTHVHKSGDKHNNDHFVPGVWTDGAAGAGQRNVGTWLPKGQTTVVDAGLTHAAKDFYVRLLLCRLRSIVCASFVQC